MDVVSLLILSLAVAWASGINLYATLLLLGLLQTYDIIVLPAGLQILSDPVVIGVVMTLYFVEFFADKIPGVDTAWDVLQTFVRIPAGALLAAGIVGDLSAPTELAMLLTGGALATSSHLSKAGSRLMINTSPEPFSNSLASITEDLLVIAGLWLALTQPWIFIVLLVGFVLLTIWLLPRLFRAIKTFIATLRGVFQPASTTVASPRLLTRDESISDADK
ncbi:putative transmembrane protein [Methylophaga frappieri]|uniref:Putative transmembrane protein n=1 Tax=Methylophaga frappieri (strain ATCC BAA-2434 / DSM 25690 / JAM7) TaxID=754477 RepID=I1YKH0_METFJ|nr:DUF4126 domain-containing protein [Methylophaga frappieri]AFJ03413.1 putative transmembrane protein [Methylophaga frappieri]